MIRLFVAEVTRAAVSPVSKLVHYQARMDGAEGDESGSGKADEVVALQPLGLTAVPNATRALRAICVQLGNQVLSLGSYDKSNRPTLDSGTVALHGLERVAAAVRILVTGEIRIDADSGKDVIVNGGSAKVGRVGDSINLQNVVFSPGTGGASLTINGHPCSPTPSTFDAGAITSGADHMLA